MLLETRVLNVNIGRMDVIEYLFIVYYSNIGIRIRGKLNLFVLSNINVRYNECNRILVNYYSNITIVRTLYSRQT